MKYDRQKAIEAEQKFLKDPNTSTRNNFIIHHQKLIYRVVNKYKTFISLDQYDDLLQEGMIGLIKASQMYSPDKGAFSTYGTFWILSYVQRFIARQRGHDFCISRKIAFSAENLLSEEEKLVKNNLKTRLSFSPKETKGSEEDLFNLEEVIKSNDLSLDDLIDQKYFILKVEQTALDFIKTSSKKEVKKVILYKRILTPAPLTLGQIADLVNISTEGVRINERPILDHLRKKFENTDCPNFLSFS